MLDIVFSRAGNRLLGPLSLTIHPGDVVWLQGPNGRGKTSVLKLAMQLLQPDSGEVRWPAATMQIPTPVFVGHHNGLKDDLTVQQALTFAAQLHGWVPDPVAMGASLKRLSVHSLRHRCVGQLSQGEKRRVALARLLLQKTPLWILDEPLEALDSVGVSAVADILKEHAAAGGAVLMTSHIPVPLPFVWTMELGAPLLP